MNTTELAAALRQGGLALQAEAIADIYCELHARLKDMRDPGLWYYELLGRVDDTPPGNAPKSTSAPSPEAYAVLLEQRNESRAEVERLRGELAEMTGACTQWRESYQAAHPVVEAARAVRELISSKRLQALFDSLSALDASPEPRKLLVSDEWLRRKIASDPDVDTEAGRLPPLMRDTFVQTPGIRQPLSPETLAAAADFYASPEPAQPEPTGAMGHSSTVERLVKVTRRTRPEIDIQDDEACGETIVGADGEQRACFLNNGHRGPCCAQAKPLADPEPAPVAEAEPAIMVGSVWRHPMFGEIAVAESDDKHVSVDLEPGETWILRRDFLRTWERVSNPPTEASEPSEGGEAAIPGGCYCSDFMSGGVPCPPNRVCPNAPKAKP